MLTFGDACLGCLNWGWVVYTNLALIWIRIHDFEENILTISGAFASEHASWFALR